MNVELELIVSNGQVNATYHSTSWNFIQVCSKYARLKASFATRFKIRVCIFHMRLQYIIFTCSYTHSFTTYINNNTKKIQNK